MPTGIYQRKTMKEGKRYTVLPKICLIFSSMTLEEKQLVAVWFKSLSNKDRKWIRSLANITEL